jgi:hypothetical protein
MKLEFRIRNMTEIKLNDNENKKFIAETDKIRCFNRKLEKCRGIRR